MVHGQDGFMDGMAATEIWTVGGPVSLIGICVYQQRLMRAS